MTRSCIVACLSFQCIFLSLVHAKTYESPVCGYRVEAPKGWVGKLSGNKSSLRLTAHAHPELTVTFQAKRVNTVLKGSMVMQQFKSQYRAKKRTEPKVVVSVKPSKAHVGEYTAFQYGFRWKNFIDEVLDERSLWFNARNLDTKALLLFKVELQGPAVAMKNEAKAIAYILASFVMFEQKKPDTPEPTTAPPPTRPPVHVVRPTPAPTQQAAVGGGSAGTSAGDDDDDDASDYKFTNVRKTQSDYSHLFGKVRKRNVAGLMSHSKRIEDPERLNRLNKTIHNRNTARTAEQRARARKYFGGMGQAVEGNGSP